MLNVKLQYNLIFPEMQESFSSFEDFLKEYQKKSGEFPISAISLSEENHNLPPLCFLSLCVQQFLRIQKEFEIRLPPDEFIIEGGESLDKRNSYEEVSLEDLEKEEKEKVIRKRIKDYAKGRILCLLSHKKNKKELLYLLYDNKVIFAFPSSFKKTNLNEINYLKRQNKVAQNLVASLKEISNKFSEISSVFPDKKYYIMCHEVKVKRGRKKWRDLIYRSVGLTDSYDYIL